MKDVHIPAEVLRKLPASSLVRRLYEEDKRLPAQLVGIARGKIFARLEAVKKEMRITK